LREHTFSTPSTLIGYRHLLKIISLKINFLETSLGNFSLGTSLEYIAQYGKYLGLARSGGINKNWDC
jgi:hypothetical protein